MIAKVGIETKVQCWQCHLSLLKVGHGSNLADGTDAVNGFMNWDDRWQLVIE